MVKFRVRLFQGINKRTRSIGILRNTNKKQNIQNRNEKNPSHEQVSPVSDLTIKKIARTKNRKNEANVL